METVPYLSAPGRRLGKKSPRFDKRTLRLASYIEKRRLPKVPKTHNLSRKTVKAFPDLGMMLNDEIGLCTCAALAHMQQTWSVFGGKPRCPSDDQILEAYGRINGGVDEGAAMLDALKLARREGVGGNPIHAFVAIDPRNHDQVRTAAFLFGGLYVGLMLPRSAQFQDVWEIAEGNGSEPNSWGGHAASIVDYSPKGVTVVTWGALQRMSWEFLDRYCDELFCLLEEDYVGSDNRSPQGFSLNKLAADLKGLS